MRLGGAQPGAFARATAAYEADDRQALALLLLPFLFVALAIGASQSLRPLVRPAEVASKSRPAPIVPPGRVAVTAPTAPTATAVTVPPTVTAPPLSAPPVVLPPSTALPAGPPQLSSAELALPPPAMTLPATMPPFAAPPVDIAALDNSPALPMLPAAAPAIDVALAAAVDASLPAAAPALDNEPRLALPMPALETANAAVAALAPDLAPDLAVPALQLAPGRPDLGLLAPPPAANVCVAEPRPAATVAVSAISPPADAAAFGVALAEAAKAQTREFVVYNDKYRRIAYPMGDVPSFYGVCTDVLIRAYRTFGIDLQTLVQTTRMGSGDPSIDHRRVDTLRRFFAAHGQSLPVTDFAEDYRPGDVVSYWRPQNRHSRTHIAIVANEIGPSGRPMIVHNRGWGPQLEDGLFVDQITGHYRFSGLKTAAPPPAAAGKPMPPRRVGADVERKKADTVRRTTDLAAAAASPPAR